MNDAPKSHNVVLSSQYFFRRLTAEAAEGLRELILAPFDDVRFLCYVRHPADRYLSSRLQVVRHSARFSARPKRPKGTEDIDTFVVVRRGCWQRSAESMYIITYMEGR